MDPEKAFWAEPWDNSFQNFLVGMIGLVMFIILVAFLWQCCDFEWTEDKTKSRIPNQSFPVTPIYAHELEPGLVVLQSQDGEFFRILQECDNKRLNKQTDNSAACVEPPIGETTIQYIPQYTRPYYQNQPTAPPARPDTNWLVDLTTTTPPVPPPYSQY